MATRLTLVEKACWRLDRKGSFSLSDSNGRLAALRGRKARAIVAFLGTHSGERICRDRLIELLWPDRGEAQARGSLRQSLLEIRRAAPTLISSDQDHVWIECARLLDEHWDRCSADEQLFEDLDGITPEFDDWLRCERAGDAAEEWTELQRKAEDLLARGQGAATMPLVERMRSIDQYNEDWLRLAMRAESQAGHPAGIQQRFRDLDQILKRELGVSLSAQTRALHDELLAELSRPVERHLAESPSETLVEAQVPSRSKRRRSPWLSAAGIAGLLITLGLSQSAQTAGSGVPRIAVLPFAASAGVDSAIAEGISEEILGNLSQQRELQTIGRTSSWVFKDKAEDLRRVGRTLDVRYVVEGSVRREGEALRLNVALIDARDASTLWSGRFTSPSGNAQGIEDAVTGAINRRLGVAAVTANRHTNAHAFELYMRAKGIIRNRDWPRMTEARDLLREALRIDPNFAPAWAQLGGALNFLCSWSIHAGDQSSAKIYAEALFAARRAVALDPSLAEGHQMLAFVSGFDSEESRAHIIRAFKLQPRDPQTVYWVSLAALQAGDFALAERAARQAMAIDPLWKRPVEFAGIFSIEAGRRADAYAYLARLRAGDPSAAISTEMSFAASEGDLSRVVQIGRDPENREIIYSTDGAYLLASVLNQLGYVRESLVVDYSPPFERSLRLRKLTSIETIRAETRDIVGTVNELQILVPVLLELARTNRHADIVALYYRPGSRLNGLQQIRPANRLDRAAVAGIVADALAKSGRPAEAAKLLRAADEAGRVILQNRKVPPDVLEYVAANEAIMGRKDKSLALLEKAVASGWFHLDGANFRLDEMPWYSGLRHEPRFQALVRKTNAHIAKERRETEALELL